MFCSNIGGLLDNDFIEKEVKKIMKSTEVKRGGRTKERETKKPIQRVFINYLPDKIEILNTTGTKVFGRRIG
jgi:hypothetical protein